MLDETQSSISCWVNYFPLLMQGLSGFSTQCPVKHENFQNKLWKQVLFPHLCQCQPVLYPWAWIVFSRNSLSSSLLNTLRKALADLQSFPFEFCFLWCAVNFIHLGLPGHSTLSLQPKESTGFGLSFTSLCCVPKTLFSQSGRTIIGFSSFIFYFTGIIDLHCWCVVF